MYVCIILITHCTIPVGKSVVNSGIIVLKKFHYNFAIFTLYSIFIFQIQIIKLYLEPGYKIIVISRRVGKSCMLLKHELKLHKDMFKLT